MELEILNNAQKYERPQKGFIAVYKSIRKAGNVVIQIFHYGEYLLIGKVWENGMGGGSSLSIVLQKETEKQGCFVITEDQYEILKKSSLKGKKMENGVIGIASSRPCLLDKNKKVIRHLN
jgi:hypothetical protein